MLFGFIKVEMSFTQRKAFAFMSKEETSHWVLVVSSRSKNH